LRRREGIDDVNSRREEHAVPLFAEWTTGRSSTFYNLLRPTGRKCAICPCRLMRAGR
jgi:hypothetical protein